jgi:hypothetical protein
MFIVGIEDAFIVVGEISIVGDRILGVGEGACFEIELFDLLLKRYVPIERIIIIKRIAIINGHLGNEEDLISDFDWFSAGAIGTW